MTTIWIPDTIEDERLLAAFVAKRLALTNVRDFHTIGVVRDKKLAAACLYMNYRGTDIEMSIASQDPRWATRGAIQAFLDYPLSQLDCRRVTAICAAGDAIARKFLKRVGFRHEGTLLDAMDDDHAILFGMTRRWYHSGKCKWNGAHHGEKERREQRSSAC